MQSMEPQYVEATDILKWLKQSFELINRRFLPFLILVCSFFLVLFFCTQAMSSVNQVVSPVFLLMGFLVFTAFIFYFSIAGLIMISYSADHSQNIQMSAIIQQLLQNQKGFLKMAILGTCIGLFYWYASLLLNVDKSVLGSSEQIISLLSKNSTLVFYLLKTSAVFLYFVVLVMFTLRTFFSVPLILFHDLSYAEAQLLSQKAILKNLKVMSSVLMMWIVVFMMAMNIAPVLAVILLPVFAAFIYVAYRHIFLGLGSNEKVRARKTVTSYSHT